MGERMCNEAKLQNDANADGMAGVVDGREGKHDKQFMYGSHYFESEPRVVDRGEDTEGQLW